MARRRRKSKAEGQGINTQTLLVVAVLAVLGYWMFAGGGGNPRPQPGPGPEPTPDSDVVVVDDVKPDQGKDKKQDDSRAVDLKQHMLIVIRDKGEIDRDIDYIATEQNDPFWFDWCGENLLDVEFVKPDEDFAERFLKLVNEKAPRVLLYNPKTKKVIWHIEYPKGGTGPIEEKLNAS